LFFVKSSKYLINCLKWAYYLELRAYSKKECEQAFGKLDYVSETSFIKVYNYNDEGKIMFYHMLYRYAQSRCT